MSKLRVLSLFAGIGGFDLGLQRTGGFRTVAFCEIEPFARRVLRKHWPEVPIYEDVCELTAARLQSDGTFPDVIVGGFPCQDISLAGRMAGLDGAKSGLWGEMARLVAECLPRFVIIENSPVLRSRGLEQMLGTFDALGYDAEWHCLPLNAFGAPHRRDRVWIIAYPASLGDGPSQGQVQARRNFLEHNPRWASEPPVPRVDDGFPDRVDRHQRLGNAVSPYVLEVIGHAILASLEQREAA